MISKQTAYKTINSFTGNFKHPDNLRERTCPLCGSDEQRHAVELADFQFFSDSAATPKRATLRQMQCRHCLTLFLNPCYTNTGFHNLFAEAGQSYGSTALRPTEQKQWLHDRGLLPPSTVVLDVGCYEGTFLSSLPATLIRQGVDIDVLAIERGRIRNPGLELIHSSFDKFTPSNEPQVITLFHVLEHLTEPAAVLARLHVVSAKKAKLVVEVPVLEWGKTNDVCGFFSVQHVTHFSINTVSSMLSITGWKILEAEKMTGYNGYRILAEKASPSFRPPSALSDMAYLQETLAAWFNAQHVIEKKLSGLDKSRPIIIWGAGLHTEYLYQTTSLFLSPEQRFLLIDSDPIKQGKSWRGIPIQAPSALVGIDWEDTQLLISSYGGQSAITKVAITMGVPLTRLITLYDEIHVY